MSERNEFSQVIKGMFVVFGLHILFVFIVQSIGIFIHALNLQYLNQILSKISSYVFLRIGITQLIYTIPYCLFLDNKNRYAEMKGAILGIIITALVNGACWVSIYSVYS
jgi:hypothetical protein